MRISDWSSDVCSSDLPGKENEPHGRLCRNELLTDKGIGQAKGRHASHAGDSIFCKPVIDQIVRGKCRIQAFEEFVAARYMGCFEHFDQCFRITGEGIRLEVDAWLVPVLGGNGSDGK